jgi:hypothetical protein
MNDVFYDFEWTVAPDYEWQDVLDEDGKPLFVAREGIRSLESETAVELAWKSAREQQVLYGPLLSPLIKNSADVRRYYPMRRENAGLFREFGELSYTDKDSMLGFARRYGGLGLHTDHQTRRFRDENGDWVDHLAFGESYLQWALEICHMREGLRWQTRKRRRGIEESRRLKWLFDRNLQHVQFRMGFDPTGELKVLLQPLTLISAMWLQLAMAISGEKRFVACKFCHRPFEISTDTTGFRSHREFCTDSCKTKDYRKRKRTALRLASEGKTVREISDKISTDNATVRAWLGTGKARRGVKSGEA